jgi:Cu(I)/Ag(I) efflux system protein CusF
MRKRPLHCTVRVAIAVLASLQLSNALAEWAEGQVRRVDPTTQKITIKHGEIKSIDMPPMTMVFNAREPAILEGIQVNDTIEFQAEADGSKYFVTSIRRKSP